MSSLEGRFRELCDGWALHALSEEELAELRKLLGEATPEMISTCRELERAALHLAVGVEPATPPAAVKTRILAAVSPRREATGTRSEQVAVGGHPRKGPMGKDWAARLLARLGLDRPRAVLAFSAALLVLAIGLGFHILALNRSASHDEQRIVDLSEQLAERERLLQVLKSREVEVVILDGLDLNPRGYGKIIWDVENRVAVLQVANLPPVSQNASYQFWVYPKEGEPISSGTFAVRDPERDTFFRLEGFTSIDKGLIRGFLITLEAEHGASQPGEAWYMGARLSP